MPAPKGHKKYNDCVKPKKYTPQSFEKKANEYFDWCDKNPWFKNEVIKSGDRAGAIIKIPTLRPYTIIGLCTFLDIDIQTFYNYEKKEKYKTYFEVLSRVRRKIETNQTEGALVDAYNPTITARLLGLREKTEIDHTINGTQEIIVSSPEVAFELEKLKEKFK